VEPLFLSLEEVLEIHRQQIERYGGASGVRDLPLLESAIAQPQGSFASEFLHASIPAMAAAYLLMNDWEPTFTEDALAETVLAVAASSMTKDDLVQFFQVNSAPRSNTSG
jgi:death-on-curing protein